MCLQKTLLRQENSNNNVQSWVRHPLKGHSHRKDRKEDQVVQHEKLVRHLRQLLV